MMKKQLLLVGLFICFWTAQASAQINPKRWQGTWKVLRWNMTDQDLLDVFGSKPSPNDDKGFTIVINPEANRVKVNGLAQGTFSPDLVLKASGKKLVSEKTVNVLNEDYQPIVELKTLKTVEGPGLKAIIRVEKNGKIFITQVDLIRALKTKR